MIIDGSGFEYILYGINAACLICGITIIIINNPYKEILRHETEDIVVLSESTMMIIRSLLLVLFYMATVICNIDLFK